MLLTKVLDVLVANDGEGTALRLSRASSGTEALEDNNTVGDGGSDKGRAVGKARPFAAGVECDVGESVSKCTREQGDMADKPRELQCLGKLDNARLQRLVGWRGWSHGLVKTR